MPLPAWNQEASQRYSYFGPIAAELPIFMLKVTRECHGDGSTPTAPRFESFDGTDPEGTVLESLSEDRAELPEGEAREVPMLGQPILPSNSRGFHRTQRRNHNDLYFLKQRTTITSPTLSTHILVLVYARIHKKTQV